MLTRRRFLGSSSVAAATAIGFPNLSHGAKLIQPRPGQKPRHIIHLVSDGMSMGTLTCADHLSQVLRQRGLTWMQLCNNPLVHNGWMNMRSLNSLVTDSSAASSSWGSGVRIVNGMVNMTGNGTPLKTLYELLADVGWKRGLVTTTEITHATPAGFVASVDNRDKATLIAAQYLSREVDVLLGGGRKYFDPAYRLDKRDLWSDFQAAGYHTMQTRAELEKAPLDRPWLGTFARSHLPFTVDQRQSPQLQDQVPTLATMTRAALNQLGRARNFILQVEGGRVDHGCHNCDAAGALYDQIAFDEAIDVCLDFQKQVPDTLILITTDHGNANLGLNGMGTAYGQSTWLFYNLENAKQSFSEMLKPLQRKVLPENEEPEKDEEADKKREAALSKEEKEAEKARKKKEEENVAETTEIVDIVHAATGYKMSKQRAERLRPFLMKKGAALYELMNSDVCALGQVMANYYGIGFTGSAHTADYVPVTTIGPGAERFRGFIQNTDVFNHYTDMTGIDYRNQQEPLITGLGPDAGTVEHTESYRDA